jgi:hypothetical protein
MQTERQKNIVMEMMLLNLSVKIPLSKLIIIFKNSQQFKDKLLAASSNGDDVFAVEGIKLEDVFGTN